MPERSANKARYFFEPAQLPEDKLQVADFTGEEQISQLYQFELTLMSDDPEIDFGSVVNQPATFTMMRRDEKHPIHGLVANFEQGSHSADQYMYRATLVPRLWRLSLTHQSRIFQDMTVEDIVRQVLKESGLTSQDFRFSLNSSYPAREYCAQYQETDLNFVRRLLEHEGIQFFFVQGEGAEEIVFSDHGNENPPIAGDSAISYHKGAGMVPDERETVREFIYRERAVTGKVKVKDYNYETPSASLEAESQINSDMPGMHYEYGPHFRTQSEGERLAKVRNEEIECQRKVVDGDGRCLRFRAGHQFDLERHYRGDLNAKYLITKVRHVGSQRVGMGLDPRYEDEVDYRNEFKCIPATVQYRPPRTTPVPRVPGVMTAEVDGSGDYAYLDDQGRYRAKMHFDQRDKSPGTASHPIRMKQPYTGKGEAGFHEPSHPGTEMVWACENGDPDRPMALGTAPNPTNPAPVKSENNSQHVIRTTSENEFIIEDQEDQERVTLYSPKHNSVLSLGAKHRNNEGATIVTDKTASIHGDAGTSVYGGNGIYLSAWQPSTSDGPGQWLNKLAPSIGMLTSAAFAKLSGGGIKQISNAYEFISALNTTWGIVKYAMVQSGQRYEEAGVKNDVTQAFQKLSAPGIFATCPGGYDVITGDAVTFIPNGGFNVNTPMGAAINALDGVSMVAGKDIQSYSKEGKIEMVADKDIIKLDATKKSVLFHGKEIVGAEGEEQVILESGDDSITLNADSSASIFEGDSGIIVKAKDQIILKCGKSSITLDSNGKIKIEGMNIDIEGTQNVNVKGMNISSEADMKNDIKGAMINSKASGVNTVKGSMTKVG